MRNIIELFNDEKPRTKAESYPACAPIGGNPGLNFFPLSLTPTNLYLKQLCDDMARLQKKMEILDVCVKSNLRLTNEVMKLQGKIKKRKSKK